MDALSSFLPSQFVPFLITATLIELTPGPNMTYLALVSAVRGRKAGLATVAGIAAGLGTVGLIASLGVAEMIQMSPVAYEALRWCGVLFLLYLAWEGWTSGSDVVVSPDDDANRHFSRGLITNLLNPKAGIFYVSVLPTFIDAAAPPMPQAIALTLTYVAVATAVHLLIVALAGSLEPFLNDPKREVVARRLLSLLLALVALWFAWSTAR